MSNPSNPSIAQSFKAGDKLAGCYTLKEMFAPQGSCVVWLAHDEELNKDIVLHFIPDSVAADARAMSELKQEAKRNRQLIHPRIIRVHDLVEDEKWAAISMDHVPGETLAALQQKRPKNAFNPSELAAGIAELCLTLEDAHRIELFHRDLTPENIVATGNGIMVQKFGLSRVILDSLARGGQPIAASRDVAYISPQQLDGDRPSRADDIYSLGASIYDLLTGAPPFPQGDVIPQVRKTVPPPVSERRAAREIAGEPVPTAWDDAVAACLAKNPEERPKTAAETSTRFSSAKPGAAAVAPAPAADAAPAAGVAAVAAAATEKPAPAKEPAAAAPEPPPAATEAPKTAQPEPQPPAKQPKRPWAPSPGKAPVIAEATVLSNTPVPKGEAKAEPKAETKAEPKPEPKAEPATGGSGAKKGGPGGPTTPTGFPLRAFVEVESEPKRPKGKSPALLFTGIAVLGLIIIIGYLVAKNNGGSGTNPENAVVSDGTDSQTASAPPEVTASPVAVEAPSPAAESTPAPTAVAEASPPAPVAVAESPAPTATPVPVTVAVVPAAEYASLSDAQADQLIADKSKAVDQAKAALAEAEKDAQDKAAAQTSAASVVQTLQAQIKQKADAAAAAKAATDAAAAALAQQQQSLQQAQADADAAQKAAAAKAQAADQLRRTVQDAEVALQQQQTAAEQAAADSDQAAKTVADRQQAADDAAKAAADAEKARQQQAQAVAQDQADLAQAQAGIAQRLEAEKARKDAEEAARIQKQREAEAAEEAARVQQQREAEAARLTAQATAAAKAAEDAQKALDAAKKAVEDAQKAQAEAEREAAAARNGTLPLPTPEASPSAAPSATPPASAAASPSATPAPAAPSLAIRPPSSDLKVDEALSNSLGMRFAPVGRVLFSVWLTRVQDFAAFAKATGYASTSWQDPGFKQTPDHPVVNVSWNDANQFCLWLTEKEHRAGILSPNETYRLPTDLEWSDAVGLPRETDPTPAGRDMDIPDVYPWGTQWPPPPGAGNYTGEETDADQAIKGYNDGFAWTSPVGSFTANKFGLYDMGGNVWEWCEDWWNSEQKAKVVRGGSWSNGALRLSLLSSCRERARADSRMDDFGFRVVIAQESAKVSRHRTEPPNP